MDMANTPGEQTRHYADVAAALIKQGGVIDITKVTSDWPDTPGVKKLKRIMRVSNGLHKLTAELRCDPEAVYLEPAAAEAAAAARRLARAATPGDPLKGHRSGGRGPHVPRA